MAKIVQVARNMETGKGGVEKHVRQVNRELEKLGHQVTVFSLAEKKLDVLNKKLVWREIWRRKNELFSADIIQVHDVWWWLVPVWPFIFHKLFLTQHGWEGIYPISWRSKLSRLIAMLLSRKTLHVGGWIQEFYWGKPNEISYGAVDMQPKVVFKKLSPKMQLNIVFLGRISESNEIDLVLHTLTHLKDAGLKFKVTFVGDGEYRHLCEPVGKVTGMVNDPSPYLVQADIIFASSYLSIWEAFAMGKTVAAPTQHPLKQRYLATFPGFKFLHSGRVEETTASVLAYLNNESKQRKMFIDQLSLCEQNSWARLTTQYLRMWDIK